MPKYQLTKRDAAYLTIEINGKEYNIPLANSLKVKEVKKLLAYADLEQDKQVDFLIAFLGSYIDTDVVENMTVGDMFEIFSLWSKANQEAGGISLGE